MSLFPSTLTGRVLDDGVTEPPVIELQGISAGQLSLVLTQYTPLETSTQHTADIGTNVQGQVAALPAAPDLTPYALAADLAAAEGLVAANASGLTAVNTSLTLGLASKANQSALDALQVQVDGKSTPASVDLKLANHPTTAAMNSSIASTNNATLATVAATYALKSVVDQLAIDVAARQTAADVDQRVATALLSYLTQTAYQAGQGPSRTPAWTGTMRRSSLSRNAGPFATAGDLSNLQVTLQSAIHNILAEIATLGGATNLVNAAAWLGNVTWDLLAGTNQIRNLPRHGPAEHPARQRRLDPELRLRCLFHAADGRRHRRGPHQLLHESRGHRHHRGGHRREQGLHRHPARRLQHDGPNEPGHHRCAGALRDRGPAGRRRRGSPRGVLHQRPNGRRNSRQPSGATTRRPRRMPQSRRRR